MFPPYSPPQKPSLSPPQNPNLSISIIHGVCITYKPVEEASGVSARGGVGFRGGDEEEAEARAPTIRTEKVFSILSLDVLLFFFGFSPTFSNWEAIALVFDLGFWVVGVFGGSATR